MSGNGTEKKKAEERGKKTQKKFLETEIKLSMAEKES